MTKIKIRQKNSDPPCKNLQKCSLYHFSLSKNVDFLYSKTSIFNFFFGGGTFWTPEKHPKTILREMPFWGVIGSIIKFNYCRNQPYSMTLPNGAKEFIYFPHHPPIGCLSQLNIFVREKMFPRVTFPPARKCFLPDMTV